MKKLLIVMLFLGTSILFAVNIEKELQFLVKTEPKVHAVYYDKYAKKVQVVVDNDGSNKNGFAEYIHITLHSDKPRLLKHINYIFVMSSAYSEKQIRDGNAKVLGREIVKH